MRFLNVIQRSVVQKKVRQVVMVVVAGAILISCTPRKTSLPAVNNRTTVTDTFPYGQKKRDHNKTGTALPGKHTIKKESLSENYGAPSSRMPLQKKIALFLPMNGQAASFGAAIKQGFEEAKDGKALRQNNSVADHTSLQLYDTSAQPLPILLAQAQREGATMIVGPLLKENVERLSRLSPKVPVLALNRPEYVQPSTNICYFALSPEDEASDAARRIYEQGKVMPLLLIPKNSLGSRISSAFAEQWQKLGGETVLRQFLSSAELKRLSNEQREIQLTGVAISVEGISANPEPNARPVDAVYIIASQHELEIAKSLIALGHKKQNISLYASSRSVQAGSENAFSSLEGIEFSDIPLLMGGHPSLMQRVSKSFDGNYSMIRLYAMGTDAWFLTQHFDEIRTGLNPAIEGNTGRLKVFQDCVIKRRLGWGKYHQGILNPVQ